jgi:hypothetical protein
VLRLRDVGRQPQLSGPLRLEDNVVAFLAKDPPLLGTTLVAPRAHREQVTADFEIEEYLALQRLVYRVAEAVRQELPTERLYIMSLGSQSGNGTSTGTWRRCRPVFRIGSSSLPPSGWSAGSLRCPMTTWRISPGASVLGSRGLVHSSRRCMLISHTNGCSPGGAE